MAQPVFLKYFTQHDGKRLQAGFSTIDGEIKNEAQRLRDILTARKILGGNQKGYFRYREQMPRTVSFTGANLENLDLFFTVRSQFGLAVLASRIPQAKPVIYLDSYAIYCGAYNHDDKWRVDLIRVVEECSSYNEFEGQGQYLDGAMPQKPYDFRWEQEWRLKVPPVGVSFQRVDFVFAPGEENCKIVRERFGQEAYDVTDHIKRVSSYRAAHQGKSPPLEAVLGKHFLARNDRIKEAKPKEGIVVMPEIVELAWDEINATK